MKFQYKILQLGLIFQTLMLPFFALGQTANPAATLLGGTTADGSSWVESPWFGWYWVAEEHPGWVYSLEWETYLYAAEGEGDLVYLWEYPTGNWFITGETAHPWAWNLASHAWVDTNLLEASRDWVIVNIRGQGTQFAVAAGPDQRLHLVSEVYYQYDKYGNKILWEPYGDAGQSQLNFPPAMAVSKTGEVHMVTRDNTGYSNLNLRYRKRLPDGTLVADYQYGAVTDRNYVIGVALPDEAAPVLLHTSTYGNVWGDVRLYQAGATEATPLGDVSDIWRADNDARLMSYGNKVYLIAGLNNTNGRATITWGQAGPDLVQEMIENQRVHNMGYGGEDRRGFPDLALDGNGTAHFIYGAYQTIQYNRYNSEGQKALPDDIRLFRQLGEYHLSAGLGAIGVSDDGAKVVAVGLETDGSKEANVCKILWTHSLDGGNTWSTPESLGAWTSGGEGRLRPRIVSIGSTFYLFYYDIQTGYISMGIRTL